MKTTNQWVAAILSTVLAICVVALVIISANKENPTNAESLMLGTMISVLSILCGLLANHLYFSLSTQSAAEEAKKSYDEKIKTFAHKAAEKVFNLSNELDRLVETLKTAIEESEDGDKDKVIILVLREKLLSAVHLLETLKSMNNTSLSDWKGIIGDDIKMQLELQREISDELEEHRELIEGLQSRVVGSDNNASAEMRLQRLEERIVEKVGALPFAFRPARLRVKKQDVKLPCPGCNAETVVKVRPRQGASKSFQCSGCRHFVSVQYESETESQSEMIPEQKVTTGCHVCKKTISFDMPMVGGFYIKVACNSCGSFMSAVRTNLGVKYQSLSSKNLTDEFLNLVMDNIPAKPWPTGMDVLVAKKMGVSEKIVRRAIGKLVATGRLEGATSLIVAEAVCEPSGQ